MEGVIVRAIVAFQVVVACLGAVGLEPADAQDVADSWDSRPRLEGSVELRMGEVLGAEEFTFGYITGIAQDSSGRIYVADGDASSVRVYDRTGRHVFDFGRSGQGPGEFLEPMRSPCALRWVETNQLWMVSPPYWLEVFAVESDGAKHLTSLRTPGGELACDKPIVGDGGQVAAIVYEPESYRRHGTRVRMDTLGNVISRLELPEAESRESLGWAHASVPDPNDPGDIQWAFASRFSPRDLLVHSPNGKYARAITSRYVVRVFDQAGRQVATITGQRPGPLLTEEEEVKARRRLDSLRGGMPDVSGATFDGYEIPDRKPPIRDSWFDEDGRIWVEIWPATDRLGRRVAHVYRSTGTPLFTAEWPDGIDLSGGVIHGCVGIGIQELDYETRGVARVSFAAAGSDAEGSAVCAGIE